ncbi:MAG TPA: response regulator [Pyrinomonadaceae bacterium]|nr:response regulator [Pyrinomonadaceae bacterium]
MSTAEKSGSPRVEILIVEDSPTQAQKLQYILEQKGYPVTLAANGVLALAAARQNKPTLIISDVVMPEMDGYELCRQVKSDPDLADVPVILVTTLSDPRDVILGLECRADNFILKPYDERYLLGRVQFVLINREMRQTDQPGMGLEIYFEGQRHFITADRLQILNLLLSTYEAAMRRNRELSLAQDALQQTNSELLQRTAELEAANKDLEAFSYSVSHDLRGPLRAINGFSAILLEDHAAELSPDARQLLTTVIDTAKQMNALIEDLLRFSRLGTQSLSKRPVNIANLVHEVLDELGRDREGRQIEIQLGDLPDCVGDHALIKQVFVNLLSNAFKFTGHREKAMIEIGCAEDHGSNVYFVRDNGAGFDVSKARQLFGVFQRFHSQHEFEGTGVGLSIVQRIVVRHGGRIWAEAEVEKGAVFHFILS